MSVTIKAVAGIGAVLLGSADAQTCGLKGATSAANPLIVGGKAATECEWKWQVGFRSAPGSPSKPWCGGMLIDPQWVLTAAHCMDGSQVAVVAGEYDTTSASGNEQEVWSSEIYSHPNYNPQTMDSDYALVKLSTPMTMSECVGTVCLPEAGNDVAPGSTCWITGWGTLQSGGSQPSVLQEAEVKIYSQQECKDSEYDADQITDTMICAAGVNDNGDNTDACQGDSGGPLVCENNGVWSVYGATSWGIGCAFDGYPGVWARVEKELTWIKETMSGTGTPPVTCPEWCGGRYCWYDGCKPCC